ncbi:MAG TPA: hypothetical protein VF817_04060 [Patescibacteria group bacterium]
MKMSKNLLLLAYKLLHDALFLLLLTAAVSLVSEGLLPGVFSNHLSPLRIFILLLLVMMGIVALGNFLGISYQAKHKKRTVLIPLLVVFMFLLIGNSLLKLALWQNLLITLFTLAIFYFFYEILIASEE